jgi:pyruvate/2-oxoglutarate dehydrogenase complex dihydrolipoamide dehydrogenase (E3) component
MAADEQVSGRVPSRPHSMSADDRFDAVVIGAGPGGRGVARRLAKAGRRVAVVEDELVGGECPFWACIPSKALLRPAEARGEAVHVAGLGRPPLDWAEVARYRDYMVSGHDDTKKTKSLTDAGIEVVRGRGRVDGPGRVSAGEHALQAEHVVIATGTTSAIPPIEGLDGVAYWTNREATAMETVPASAVVLGGGPVGVELGQMLARFGARTTIVEALPRLLARETPEVGDRLGELLRAEGIEVRLGAKAVRVEANRVHLDDGSGVEGDRLVVAVGRKPRTDDLGLETVGIEPTDGGTLAVDAHCCAGDGLWAVGDVTGVAQFTHVAAYQAGVAVADMLGTPREADYRAVPRVVFTDPEVAAVGETPEQARERGADVAVVTGDLADLDRTETYGHDLSGGYGLVADRAASQVLGAWAVGPLASEWIHPMALAISARIPLDLVGDGMAQFPTFAEAWPMAARTLSA